MGIFSKIKQIVSPESPDPDYPLRKEERETYDPYKFAAYPLEVKNARTPERKTENQRFLEEEELRNPGELPDRRWGALTDEEKIEFIKNKSRRDRKKKTSKSIKRKPVRKATRKRCKCK